MRKDLQMICPARVIQRALRRGEKALAPFLSHGAALKDGFLSDILVTEMAYCHEPSGMLQSPSLLT